MSAPRFRLPTALAAAALGVVAAMTSCDVLFGSFAGDNPDNCTRNTMLCAAPGQACNTQTKVCEPALVLSSVDPPGGSNVGGEVLTLSGQRFVSGMTVSIDGVPAQQVMVQSDQQLTVVSPPRPGVQGLVNIELGIPGQTVDNKKLFRYYSPVSFEPACFKAPDVFNLIASADLNHDGKSDFVVSGFMATMAYLSSGDGKTFTASATVPQMVQPPGLVIADVNGDGKPDLVSSVNLNTSTFYTLPGNGDGTFGSAVNSTTSGLAYGLAVGDANGN